MFAEIGLNCLGITKYI